MAAGTQGLLRVSVKNIPIPEALCLSGFQKIVALEAAKTVARMK
jgi:hypothetical protein